MGDEGPGADRRHDAGPAAKRPHDAGRGDPIDARVAENRWFWLLLLWEGPRRDQDEETADRIQRAHLGHLFELEARGLLTLFGPVRTAGELLGIGVLTVPTIDEAEALIADDPAVRAGRLRAEVRPWFARPASRLPASGADRPDGEAPPAPAAAPAAGGEQTDDPSREAASGLAMYGALAGWFHLLTPPADYADEAAVILRLLREAAEGPLETLLELGSGGGNTASHLGAHLRLTLTDLSPAMLDVSRTINPGAEHLVGDMRTLRLGRTFDAVLIHDAVVYLTTAADLRAAMETAWAHLRPGGALVICPDHVAETFEPSTEHGGHDGDGRALRYLEWAYDPDPSDTAYTTDFAILTREGDHVEVRHDRHVEGLFPRQVWLELLAAVGFEARSVPDEWGRDLFVGRRPSSG
jgi:SAM-dependent methyltransferase/uncharacterized protein YciI